MTGLPSSLAAVQHLVERGLALRPPQAVRDEVCGLLEADHGGPGRRRVDTRDRAGVEVELSEVALQVSHPAERGSFPRLVDTVGAVVPRVTLLRDFD